MVDAEMQLAHELQNHKLQACLRRATLVFEWNNQKDWTGDVRPYRRVTSDDQSLCASISSPWYGRLQARDALTYDILHSELLDRARYEPV